MSNGSVYRRKGTKTWTFAVDLGPDPVTGKRRRKNYYGYATRRDAEAARVEIVAKLRNGMYVDPSKQTLGAFLEEVWLPTVEPRVEAATHDNYRGVIQRYVVPRLGSVAVQAVTSAHLNGLYAHLAKCGGREERPLSPRTVRLVHVVVRKALKDAVRWNLLARNPADAADPPKQKRSQVAHSLWTVEDAQVFVASVEEDRMRCAWLLAISTGMRRGEVAGLRWRDVDLDAKSVAIRQTRTSVGYEVVVKSPKSGSQRVVALDDLAVSHLVDHRKRQNEERLAFGPGYDTSHDLVFRHEDGTPIHPELFTEWFQKRVAAAGLPHMRFHDLRHLHATLGLAAGVHPLVMSKRLGHANVSITLDTYSHVIPQMDRDAAGVVAAALAGGQGGGA